MKVIGKLLFGHIESYRKAQNLVGSWTDTRDLGFDHGVQQLDMGDGIDPKGVRKAVGMQDMALTLLTIPLGMHQHR